VNPRVRQRLLDDPDRLALQELQVHLIVGDDLVLLLPAADFRDGIGAIHPGAEVVIAAMERREPFLAAAVLGLLDAHERVLAFERVAALVQEIRLRGDEFEPWVRLELGEALLDEVRRERVVGRKRHEEVAFRPVGHLRHGLRHPAVLVERHQLDARVVERRVALHDLAEVVRRAVVQDQDLVDLARLGEDGGHRCRQKARMVVAGDADRDLDAFDGRRHERVLLLHVIVFGLGAVLVLRPDRLRPDRLIHRPAVGEHDADVLLEEAAVELVVREDGQALIEAAELLHHGRLHHQGGAADGHVLQVDERSQPRRPRAVVRPHPVLLPLRPQAHRVLLPVRAASGEPPHAVDVRIRFEVIHLLGELLRRDDLVRGDDADVFPARLADGEVRALRNAAVLIEPEIANATIVEALDRALQILGRSVVNDNQLPALIGRCADGGDHLLRPLDLIADLGTDGYQRRV
jgi:hypothetical protein